MGAPFLRLASLALLALLLDCRSLPAIPDATCGNAVVDPGEDCDIFAPAPGTSCRPAGSSVGACRLDCTASSGNACPPGWGCGTDGICRQPTGEFTRASTPVAADAWRLTMGDFDGDGRQDVLARAAIDVGGYSKLRIHYYEPQPDHTMALAQTYVLAPTVASPSLADFDGDGLTDLAFVHGGIDVMLGQGTRTLAPVAYPQFQLPQTSIAVSRLHEYGASPHDDLVFFAQQGGGSVVEVVNGQTTTNLFSPPGKGPGDLAGEMIAAAFVDDSAAVGCDQLVIAYSHANGADVYTPCSLKGGQVVFGQPPPPTHVKLPGVLTIDNGVHAGDVDGDGHVDLILGSALVAYVAYGDGTGHFHDAKGIADQAGLLTIAYADGSSSPLPFPLQSVDLDADGRADFVTSRAIIVSVPQTSAYVVAADKSPGAWTAARIADMNGDGLRDVVATSAGALDADFFVGTGGTALNPFSIATAGAVSSLAVGDFDGDRVEDVMLAQVAADPSQPQQVTIAWGQAFAPPQSPAVVGQFPVVAEAVPLPAPDTSLSSIVIVAHPGDTPTTALVSILAGNGDRQPLAPYVLLAKDQDEGTPIAITAGPFLGSTHPDMFAMAADTDSSGNVSGFRYWLVPSIGPAQFDAPVSSPVLPADFKPLYGTTDVSSHVAMLMGWGDVGSGRAPTAVTAAPDGTSEQNSAFLTAHATGGSPPSLSTGMTMTFPLRVSPEGQIEFHDVDGDGNEDAVLLTGVNASTNRALIVAWNDGSGGFSTAQELTVNDGSENPQGFALVAVDTSGRPRLAYVTRKAVVLATIDPGSRAVSGRQTIDTPESATGLAAGDVDGDGVQDLALADQGNVVILRDRPVLE